MHADRHSAIGSRILAAMTGPERRAAQSFFSGAHSTRTQRDTLREALLTCNDVNIVSDIRFYFNVALSGGEIIPACHVTAALRLLRS